MPRSYFKHEQGYINVMEDRLCFTRSGNWQEAEQTTERTGRTTAVHTSRVIVGVLLVLLGGAALGLMKGGRFSEGVSFPLTIGLMGFGCYKLYSALRTDFGPSFCIPFSKIRSVEGTAQGVAITFVNGAWKDDRIAVVAPPEAVEGILSALPLTIERRSPHQ